MDARTYAASQFLAPEDVQNCKVWTIVGCDEVEVNFKNSGPMKRLRLLLDNGSQEKQFTLNKTNVANMIKAWGPETNDWIGKPIELGTITALISGEKKVLIEIEGRAENQNSKENANSQSTPGEPSGSPSSSNTVNYNAKNYTLKNPIPYREMLKNHKLTGLAKDILEEGDVSD